MNSYVREKRSVCVSFAGSAIIGDDFLDPVDRDVAEYRCLVPAVEGLVGVEMSSGAAIVIETRVEIGATPVGEPSAESGLYLAAPTVQVLAEHAHAVADAGEVYGKREIVDFVVVDTHASIVVSAPARRLGCVDHA